MFKEIDGEDVERSVFMMQDSVTQRTKGEMFFFLGGEEGDLGWEITPRQNWVMQGKV